MYLWNQLLVYIHVHGLPIQSNIYRDKMGHKVDVADGLALSLTYNTSVVSHFDTVALG